MVPSVDVMAIGLPPVLVIDSVRVPTGSDGEVNTSEPSMAWEVARRSTSTELLPFVPDPIERTATWAGVLEVTVRSFAAAPSAR